jgi:hypothetical protein
MWFCTQPGSCVAFVGDSPENAFDMMQENHNVGPEDCEFYFVQDGPLYFVNKLMQIHKEG